VPKHEASQAAAPSVRSKEHSNASVKTAVAWSRCYVRPAGKSDQIFSLMYCQPLQKDQTNSKHQCGKVETLFPGFGLLGRRNFTHCGRNISTLNMHEGYLNRWGGGGDIKAIFPCHLLYM